jgi:D-alanine transaminase
VADVAFINGRFVPWREAVVPIDDRGFQFGDGVYEVIRTYRGKPFELEAHLRRLDRSAGALLLPSPYRHSEWRAWIEEGIAQAGYPDAKVYIQVTRGVAPRDHAFPAEVHPTTVMTIRELQPLPDETRRRGVTAKTIEDLRWGRCDIKSVNLLPNVLARQDAKRSGVFEAILIRDDLVTEGSVSNVMAVRKGVLVTAPEGPRILSGVTRHVALELARKEGLPTEERYLSRSDLYDSDEVLLTGTTVEVLPVVQIDGRQIGSGRPGSVTTRLVARWKALTA